VLAQRGVGRVNRGGVLDERPGLADRFAACRSRIESMRTLRITFPT
jgi:hypothetical protein